MKKVCIKVLKVCTILLLHVSNTCASKCAITAQRLNCSCDPERYQNAVGFTATCLNGNLNLKYDNSRNYFHVKCQIPMSISDTLFDDFSAQDQNIEIIKFEGCTLPDTTFPKSMYDLQFKKLVILCQGRTGSDSKWSSVMFQSMNYMEELMIQGCPTAVVPQDLLRLNPSLNKLYLEDNGIQTLPENLLHNVTLLKTFSVMNNAIKDFPDAFFAFSKGLENLIMKKNNLNSISLKGTKALKYLDLSLNAFAYIPEDMFLDNSLLVSINLGWNKIVNITTRPFKTLVNLSELIMSYNGPDLTLPTRFLEGLVKLKILSISDCHMTKPIPDLLVGTKNLKNLELGNNRIEEFPAGFFQHQNKLKNLELSFNDLTENISENTFEGLKSLKYLSLRKNNFSFFPDNILNPLTTLKILHFEENFLEELDLVGQSVPLLKELYLTQNRISRWKDSGLPLGDRSRIEIVDLSRNNLTDLDIYMVAYNRLKLLDLSHNPFPVIRLPFFYSQKNLIINLEDCSIETVDCSILVKSPNSKYGKRMQYNLKNNPLLCDCRQLDFQKCLQNKPEYFLNIENLECRTVNKQTYKKILNVDAQDFVC